MYDPDGLVMKKRGKRRKNTPKNVDCSCGKIAEKVAYGTYECSCGKCYMYRWGKLEAGKVEMVNLPTPTPSMVSQHGKRYWVKYYCFGNWSTDLASLR